MIGNTDGTVDVVGLTRIEGIGEEVEARPVPSGAADSRTTSSPTPNTPFFLENPPGLEHTTEEGLHA